MRDPFMWSFPIGRLFGIVVRIHWVFPIVALALIFRATSMKDAAPGVWADATTLVVLLFFVVLLHEFGHCLAAHWMNGEAREILLWPLGGLASVDVPHTARAHFWTAFGGPAVNFVICCIAALVLAFAFETSYQPPWNPLWLSLRGIGVWPSLTSWGGVAEPFGVDNQVVLLFARLFFVSWVLLLLNVLLVGFPLDGGRMLQAALWPYAGYRQSMTYAIYAGFGVVAILCFVCLVFNEVLLLFLAFYIFTACKIEMFNLESGGEDSLFGYDFSQGYTSLERDMPQDQPVAPRVRRQNFLQRWLQKRATKKLLREVEQREADEKRMDELLEKIQRAGKDSLTDEEQRFLKKVADRYRNRS